MFSTIGNIIDLIFELAPKITGIDSLTYYELQGEIINFAWYFLPMDVIGVLFSITMALTAFRIFFSIVLRVKSFIPGWGN